MRFILTRSSLPHVFLWVFSTFFAQFSNFYTHFRASVQPFFRWRARSSVSQCIFAFLWLIFYAVRSVSVITSFIIYIVAAPATLPLPLLMLLSFPATFATTHLQFACVCLHFPRPYNGVSTTLFSCTVLRCVAYFFLFVFCSDCGMLISAHFRIRCQACVKVQSACICAACNHATCDHATKFLHKLLQTCKHKLVWHV